MGRAFSPLRYPGGKAKLSAFLANALEANDFDDPIYVEPYAGGAGAALTLLFSERVQSILVNDADPRIYAFWKAITEYADKFIELLQNVKLDVEEWYIQRQIYLEPEMHDHLSLGFATFFLNRTSRSGIIHNSGPIGGYKQNGAYKIDARFNRADLVKRIRHVSMYADRIDVQNLDGLALLESLRQPNGYAQEQYFLYLDPPYYIKGGELYLNQFSPDQHGALAQYLERPYPHKWIMTYDNVEEIAHLYESQNQITFDLAYSAYERRKGKEILIYPDGVVVPDETEQLLRRAS
ncbi:DNA adenine methylase [Salinisphaera japonica]|uniref:site-specific DNA-methyltransferase (adenine-specific) n=1 Tax=Salinisphaera japonica YTM-1 TaxID=1209778 RepID=A0A423PVG2_9GAMM|nr:DNA adenine methylase [Salinisphaera japonica]ROO29575.1 DNA methyltransferase [Salinisphaera japonica YTM-1]